ncbi:MAG: recombinase family protein [Gemmatimonadetes bacterium]|nr:recombinase family protein [Gemmatimonadota bacterium]
MPIGFLRTRDDGVELDPDQRIQAAIRSVFHQFVATGSLRQTLLWFRSEGVELPAVEYGPFGRTVVWKLPVYNTLHHIITNPMYAGAYVFGRSVTRTHVTDGRARKVAGNRRPPVEWPVFLPDHHAGYISWREFEAAQAQLRENAQMKGLMSRGAPRRGQALLAGLLRCRRCGRRLHVAYSGTHGTVRRSRAAAHDQSWHRQVPVLGGLAIERAVEEAVFAVIAPGAIDAALQAAAARDANDQQQATQAQPKGSNCAMRWSAHGASTTWSIRPIAWSRQSWSAAGTPHSTRSRHTNRPWRSPPRHRAPWRQTEQPSVRWRRISRPSGATRRPTCASRSGSCAR